MNTVIDQSVKLRYLFLVFFAVNAITPRFIGLDIGGLPFLSAGRLVLLVFLAVVAATYIRGSSLLLRPLRTYYSLQLAPLLCLLIYLFIAFVSALFSSELLYSAKRVLSESFLIGVLVYVSWAALCRNPDAEKEFSYTFLLCTCIAVLFGLLDYIFGNTLLAAISWMPVHHEMYCGSIMPKVRAGNLRIQSVFDNSLTYGTFLLAALPLCSAYIRGHRSYSVTGIVLLAAIFTSLALTYSRFVWLGALIGLVALLVHGSRNLRTSYVFALILAMAFTPLIISAQRHVDADGHLVLADEIQRCKQLLLQAGFSVLEDGVDEADEQPAKSDLAIIGEDILLAKDHHTSRSFDYRLSVLRAGVTAAIENPLLGVGPGNFSTHVEGEYFSQSIRFKHHENYLVTLLAEIGFVGFIGFSAFVVFTLYLGLAAYKSVSDHHRPAIFGQGLAFGMLCFSFFFLDTMSYHQLSILFWTLSASMLATFNLTVSESKDVHVVE